MQGNYPRKVCLRVAVKLFRTKLVDISGSHLDRRYPQLIHPRWVHPKKHREKRASSVIVESREWIEITVLIHEQFDQDPA